jgi:formylglycine-generating enzyme required for sulfatase activity
VRTPPKNACRRRVGIAVGTVLLFGGAAACSLVFDASALSAGSTMDGDGSPQSGGDGDGPLPEAGATADGAPIGDEAGGGGGDGGATTDAACPGDRGPVMVRVGTFCIDSTEVTNAQYAAFLAGTAGAPPTQPSYCAWNASLRPVAGWPYPSGDDAKPVTSVDWCDAHAFCAWAGKRLCGRPGGGPADPTRYASPAESQWDYACTHAGDGQHAWPYGNLPQSTACNTADRDAGVVVPVASFGGCVGGFPGIFDMSGNAEEWEDSCTAYTPDAADSCRMRGGAPDDPASAASCTFSNMHARNFTENVKGFRCCAD